MVMSNPLTSIGETSASASWLIRGTRRSPPLLTWSHRYFAFSSPSAFCLFDLPSRCFITIKASSVTPALRSRQIERADSRVMRVIFFLLFLFLPSMEPSGDWIRGKKGGEGRTESTSSCLPLPVLLCFWGKQRDTREAAVYSDGLKTDDAVYRNKFVSKHLPFQNEVDKLSNDESMKFKQLEEEKEQHGEGHYFPCNKLTSTA